MKKPLLLFFAILLFSSTVEADLIPLDSELTISGFVEYYNNEGHWTPVIGIVSINISINDSLGSQLWTTVRDVELDSNTFRFTQVIEPDLVNDIGYELVMGGWNETAFHLELDSDVLLPYIGGSSQGDGWTNKRVIVDSLTGMNNSTPVPIPTSMLLLASGLAGLAGFRRKSRER